MECCLRDVEMSDPQQVAMPGLEIIHRVHVANGAGDAVAARTKLLGHVLFTAVIIAAEEISRQALSPIGSAT